MKLSGVAPDTGAGGGPQASSVGTDPRRRPDPLQVVVIGAVVAGVALRLWTTSPMWLDEALTANIASVGLGHLREVLEHDGAPPLYYALLAGWRGVAGDSDTSLRLLSAVFSVLSLYVTYRVGRRRGGPTVGAAALVLVATSPFAIRYATEARMYSLVALLAGVGWLAVANAMESGTPRHLAGVACCSGLLLLTHYWSFYLLAAAGGALLVVAWRRPSDRRAALFVLGAMAAGSAALFGPWLPSFLYQTAHTGTPWGSAPGPVEVAFTTLVDLGGGPHPEGQALAALLAALALLALFGRAVDRRRIELDLRTVPGVRADLAVGAAALLLGVGAGVVTGSAWASRYTSIVLPLVVLVVAFGTRNFADRRLLAGVLAVAAVLGTAGGMRNAVTDRTQADQVASAIAAAGARPGDVVAYCPDQLGPDVARVLRADLRQYTFPDLGDPRFVDWVDYGDRMRDADPARFAASVLERAEGRNIFLVWMPGYRTLGSACERVNDALGNARPGNRRLLEPGAEFFERHTVWLHPASPR